MSGILISENWIDATRNLGLGDSGVYESCFETSGALYRACMREHGRCIGRVYIDTPEGKVRTIGWVFQKRVKYEDCAETFLRETWIMMHERKPETVTTYHYRKTR